MRSCIRTAVRTTRVIHHTGTRGSTYSMHESCQLTHGNVRTSSKMDPEGGSRLIDSFASAMAMAERIRPSTATQGALE